MHFSDFLFLCCLLCGCLITLPSSQAAILDLLEPYDDSIECSGNATAAQTCTLVQGNPAALETLRVACAASPVCSTRFGQDLGPNLPVFSYLLTATYPGDINTLCLETFLYDVICDKTFAVIILELAVQQLLIQTNAADPCSSNEQFVLNNPGPGGFCRCLPDKICNTDNRTANSMLIIIFVTLAGIFLLLIGLVIVKAAAKRDVFTNLLASSTQTRNKPTASTLPPTATSPFPHYASQPSSLPSPSARLQFNSTRGTGHM